MNQLMPALRIYLFLSVFLGLGYTYVMTGVSQVLFPKQANGSLIEENGKIVGSSLIGQTFESPKYFWPRPSAIGYSPLPSGGSNLSGTQEGLKKAIDERTAKLKAAHGADVPVPQILLSASGSGLDPHISPEAALYQINRVAQARGVAADKIQQIVQSHMESRQLGILGEPRVNVLELNLALDHNLKL